MSSTLTLQVNERTIVGKQTKQLRAKGIVPAVVYGHGVETRSVELDTRVFEKIFRQAGESSLIDLSINGKPSVKVLIQEVQYDPLRNATITHVDFREVQMTEKLEAQVILKFVGEAPAVKALGGILVRTMDTITVRCLPQYLVHEIEVDVTGLKDFDESIKISDIKPPEGIEFVAKQNELIAVINKPISEEELAALESKPVADVTAVKVETEEKKAERDAEKKETTEGKEK